MVHILIVPVIIFHSWDGIPPKITDERSLEVFKYGSGIRIYVVFFLPLALDYAAVRVCNQNREDPADEASIHLAPQSSSEFVKQLLHWLLKFFSIHQVFSITSLLE